MAGYEYCNCTEFADEIAKIGCWEFNLVTRKMTWSKEMFELLGFKHHTVSHKLNAIKAQVFSGDLDLYKTKIKELLNKGCPVQSQLRLFRKDGKLIHCLFKASIVLKDGIRVAVGTVQDISPLIEIQEALDEAKKKAEDLSMAKSYFLAQASHDLRQPMQALKIFVYNLVNEQLSPKQQKIAEKINAAANNLNNLLDNLLDFSKIESGGVELEKTRFNIGKMMENLFEEVYDVLKDRKIEVRFVNHNLEIESDPILIERIIRNFISNAMKYTKDKILMGCRVRKEHLWIMVADNGVGIDEQDLPYIFDEFFQSLKIENNRKSGAGLGLPIVKKISHMLDGEVLVKSKPKKGSCFVLSLPL